MEYFQGLLVMTTVVNNMDQLPFPSPKPTLLSEAGTRLPPLPIPCQAAHRAQHQQSASGELPKPRRPNKPSCPAEWEPPAPKLRVAAATVSQQFCNLTLLKDGVTGLTHHDQMHCPSGVCNDPFCSFPMWKNSRDRWFGLNVIFVQSKHCRNKNSKTTEVVSLLKISFRV